jgi:hypothetical protein
MTPKRQFQAGYGVIQNIKAMREWTVEHFILKRTIRGLLYQTTSRYECLTGTYRLR